MQDGEKIDHTWLDYVTRSNNKVLKIRAAKLDDTGLFVCRGVNGFGKAQVNIHLIVVGKLVFFFLMRYLQSVEGLQ